MITINLLGGAKKALGRSEICIDSPEVSVREILGFLNRRATEKRIIESGNILVVVNGIDTSVLEGIDTVVRTGDTVKIVTIVHGGME